MLFKTISFVAFIILIIYLGHNKRETYDNVYNSITNNVNLPNNSLEVDSEIHSYDEESDEEHQNIKKNLEEEQNLSEDNSEEEENLLRSLTENKNNFTSSDDNKELYQDFA